MKNVFAPFAKLWLSINWQKLKPTPSVTFAVMLTLELKKGVESSREAFSLGSVASGGGVKS